MNSYMRGSGDSKGSFIQTFSAFLKIKSADDFKLFIKVNKDFLKKAAFPFVVILAVIFFWIFGSSDSDKVVVNSDNSIATATSENALYSSDENLSDPDDNLTNTDATGNSKSEKRDNIIYVDICGEVKSPGVYELKDNTRLFQLIEMAGGLTDEADEISINRASILADGQKIIIRSTNPDKNQTAYQCDDYTPSSDTNDSKININTADSIILQDIPGIGPSKALSIVSYREEHGPYKKIDDIINVSGIGERTFDNIKDYITV